MNFLADGITRLWPRWRGGHDKKSRWAILLCKLRLQLPSPGCIGECIQYAIFDLACAAAARGRDGAASVQRPLPCGPAFYRAVPGHLAGDPDRADVQGARCRVIRCESPGGVRVGCLVRCGGRAM